MSEIWKNIEDFPGYQVSNLGRVRSFWKNAGNGRGKSGRVMISIPRILKTRLNTRGGYEICAMSPEPSKRKTVYVHLLVFKTFHGDIPSGMQVDHIDGNRLNNVPSNLRLATDSQNKWNGKPKNTKGRKFKGVTFRDKAGALKWEASLKHKGVYYYLGQYSTEEDAAKAYDKKLRELVSLEDLEFVRFNFIN